MNIMSKVEHFPQHSEQDPAHQPLVRRNDVWSPLGYDTKIDVFKFLRPYDIRKFCVYVNKSWTSFCVENKRYIPHPRVLPPRTVEQRFSIDENQAYEQRIFDENTIRINAERQKRQQKRQQARHRLFLSSLPFSAILLATWSCILYLTIRINNQTEEDSTNDLLALCLFMVLSLSKSWRYLTDCYHDEIDGRCKRSCWFVWLCFRLILCLAGLGFSYFMPHLTPSTLALWIALTVIHIPDCHEFFLWIKWTDTKLCFHLPKFPADRYIFTILVSTPHFATLLATFFTFHPDETIPNIPSLIVFIFLVSIVTVYKEHHATFYWLCLGAISTLFPASYPGKYRNNPPTKTLLRHIYYRDRWIILPPETLFHILHHFPRKQLVKQYSRVNSSFFRVANSLPNLHSISDDNIRFLPEVEYSSDPFYSSNLVDDELKIQSFQCIALCNGKEYWNGRILEYHIDANELAKNMPKWYVRFPEFAIRGIPDESLLEFLRQTKQNFSNCRVLFNASIAVEMEFVEKPQELLTDIFLDAREIDLMFSNVAPEKFLKLNGVRNCDKVSMRIGNNSSFPTRQSTEAFIEWLEWKQHDPGSRRHLVLNAINFVRELVDGLKQIFETATKSLNYLVTFLDLRTGVLCLELDEFVLENDSTGERLSLFHDRKNYSFRLWRRIVTPDDSAWLAALSPTPIDPESDVMVHTGEIPHVEGIDKTFYDYYNTYLVRTLIRKSLNPS
ncbi:hypothetical protein Ddc_14534 [Ditylenchus destructor]|nr:hypothetical protein Ddc_14534 [Ditylenchus destructor]